MACSIHGYIPCLPPMKTIPEGGLPMFDKLHVIAVITRAICASYPHQKNLLSTLLSEESYLS